MPSNTIDFHALDLQDASSHADMNDMDLHAAGAPRIAICTMAPPVVLEYHPLADGEAAHWEFSPAAALTAGIGIWAAACGAALYGAWG